MAQLINIALRALTRLSINPGSYADWQMGGINDYVVLAYFKHGTVEIKMTGRSARVSMVTLKRSV